MITWALAIIGVVAAVGLSVTTFWTPPTYKSLIGRVCVLILMVTMFWLGRISQ